MSHEVMLAPPGAKCAAYGTHRPQPMRIVMHHILPQVCGGRSVPENRIPVCDSCHYSIHRLMYRLRFGATLGRTDGSTGQRSYAFAGYVAAIDAGTVDRIPNEG